MQHLQQDGSPTGAVAGQHGFQLTVFSFHAEHLLPQKIGVMCFGIVPVAGGYVNKWREPAG